MSSPTQDDIKYRLFFNKIAKDIFDILEDIKSPAVTKKFYHYTNAIGFNGIITSGALHAGDVLLMNDAEEINYAANLFIETAKQADESEILESFFKRVRDSFVQDNPTTKLFVVCFSEDPDELSQWRGYGGGRNGFAIEFDFTTSEIIRDKIVGPIPFKTANDSRRLIKVCYKKEIHLSVAKRLTDALSIFCKTLKHSHPSAGIASLLSEIGHDFVMECMLKLKHPAFHHEKEWRIVETRGIVRVPGGGLSLGDIKFKVSNNAVLPYLVLENLGSLSRRTQHKTGITGVRIGPREEIESFVWSTEAFLSSNKIIVDVKRSKVPLRF